MRDIPDNVRVELSVYTTQSQLKNEWERRDFVNDMTVDGVTFTRIELMCVFKKLIQETQT